MRAAAAHVGQVKHQVTWARTTSLPASTLSRWTDLLETSYQLVRVPAFSVNRTKRLAKSPNGKRFLFLRETTPTDRNELIVVQNWVEEMKARAR